MASITATLIDLATEGARGDIERRALHAEAKVESLTAELVGARAAFLVEQTRAEKAESWSTAYKQMLRDVLDLMPAGYMSPEHQTKLMRAWSLVTDGEHQFKPRGSK